MNTQAIIRACGPQDESVLIQMNLDFMQESFSGDAFWSSLDLPSIDRMRKSILEALSSPESISMFVAEIDGKVIGYTNVWMVYSIWSQGMIMTVDDLFIMREYRGSGVGEQIMVYLINFAEAKGFKRIQLHSGPNNKRAHNLYKKLGFEEDQTLFFMKALT